MMYAFVWVSCITVTDAPKATYFCRLPLSFTYIAKKTYAATEF